MLIYQVYGVVTPSDATGINKSYIYSTRQTPYHLHRRSYSFGSMNINNHMASFSNYMIAKDTWNIIDNGDMFMMEKMDHLQKKCRIWLLKYVRIVV